MTLLLLLLRLSSALTLSTITHKYKCSQKAKYPLENVYITILLTKRIGTDAAHLRAVTRVTAKQ